MLQEIAIRPCREGRISLPVHVRSVGHYIITPDWRNDIGRRPILQFFWGVSGIGSFDGGDGTWRLTQARVGCFLPGDQHCIRAETPNLDYWWFTLDGSAVEMLIDAFRLPHGVHSAGPCPVVLFEQLFREVQEQDINAELAASATAYRILSESMRNPLTGKKSMTEQFKKLVAEGCGDPDFSVEEIARILGIHRSTLTRLITRHCGMSPQEYLLGQRLAFAHTLLQDTSHSIKEVASLSGFTNQNYFSRTFRRRFGQSPRELVRALRE